MMTLTQSEALNRIHALGRIPTLPEVMTRVLEVLEDRKSCVDDITAILAADPVITSRILRLANSPFFGSRFEIDSIHRAIVTVGFEAVKQLALATTVLDSLASRPQSSLDPEDFWMHALGSAKASQLLAFSTPQISMPEACFTAGLLHDLGKYILALSLGDDYSAVLNKANESEAPLYLVEQRTLKTDHSEVAGWLAQRWNFPEVIVAAVKHTNEPERYDGPFRKEVFIIAIASDMARIADFGQGGETSGVALNEDRIEHIGLSLEQVSEICDTLGTMREDGRALLGMLQDA
jgi:HD-like signal output (HDOD) protein